MARDIKNLLNKKGWTGEEVGRALIASLIHDVQSKREGKDSQPLFTQAEFDRMENSLKDQFNFTSYGVFRDIYSSIVDCFNKGQGLYQQFYNGYYRYFLALEQVKNADKALADMEKCPLIMTQSQYDRTQEAAQDRKRVFKTSYRCIIFDMLQYYTGQYGEPTETPTAISAALEKTKSEPVTNKRILENWNEDWGEGYYSLEDGRRSDQMSKEEWQEALRQEWLKGYKLTIDGQPASPEETLRARNEDRILWGYKLLFNGADAIEKAASDKGIALPEGITNDLLIEQMEEELDGLSRSKNPLHGLLEADGGAKAKWNYYTEPPADLTKHDVITGGGIERYSGAYSDRLLDGDFVPEISEVAQLKEFIADYPALYKALKEDIEARIPKAKELKPAQYGKEIFTWGELADLDIAVYKHLTAPTDADILEYFAEQEEKGGVDTYGKRGRIWGKGIAIITESHKYNTNEQGDYVEDIYSPLDAFMSLDGLAGDSYRKRELTACINELMKPALSYLYAYNALINILARAYAIDGLEHLQLDLSSFESQLYAFNNLLFFFYGQIYGSETEKKRKRALIREIFEPIDPSELKPSLEATAEMQERINRLGLTAEARKQLAQFDPLIATLMERGE